MPVASVVYPCADGVGPVVLLSKTGERIEFASLSALSQSLCARVNRSDGAYRRWDISIGEAFVTTAATDFYSRPQERHFDWVLRSAVGDALSPSLIPHPPKAEAYRTRRVPAASVWRQEPVPRSGRRSSYSNYFRCPKTHGARRASLAPVEDEPMFRSARSSCQLPTAWDDIPRRLDRSWKCYRKTRWKN